MPTYKFNRTTNGPVKVTTTDDSGNAMDDYYSRLTNVHIEKSGATHLKVCFDIARLVLPAMTATQITEINAAPFTGTLAQAITALGETVFY